MFFLSIRNLIMEKIELKILPKSFRILQKKGRKCFLRILKSTISSTNKSRLFSSDNLLQLLEMATRKIRNSEQEPFLNVNTSLFREKINNTLVFIKKEVDISIQNEHKY